MKRLWATIYVVLVILGAAGCGGGETPTVIEKTVSVTPPSSGSASTPQDALKAYDLAWAEGDADAACELLVDQARQAVETEMSNRTLGGLPLNCPERMGELLQLEGPEAVNQLERLARDVSSDEVIEHGDLAEVFVAPAAEMELKKVGDSWYINGSNIRQVEPFVTKREYEETEEVVAEEADLLAVSAIHAKSREEVPYVTCPSPELEAGHTFICDATIVSGAHYQAELEVIDPEGDLVVLRTFVSHEY